MNADLSPAVSGPKPAAPADAPDPRRWKALALLCAATFMVILDAQIVILALPSIEKDLGFAAGNVQWVLSAYLISFGGLLLLGGRSADLLGRRRMFIIGTALFLIASLLCGFAWTAAVLIAARVLQGMSAAVMSPTALSILMNTFREGAERNKAIGVWSAMGGIGATSALLIGGPLTDSLGWEWIFFLNIPVAGLMLVLSPVLLRESRNDGLRRAYDPAGAATITLALVALIYALVQSPEAGWTSVRTLGLFALSALLMAAFAFIEARHAAALVPLRIFRSRTLVGGNLVMLVAGMIAWGMSVVVSLYAQKVLGYSAIVFGLGTAAMTLAAIVGSYGGQALVTRIGFRPVAMAGMALLGTGCVLLAQVSVRGSYFGDIFLGLLIFGPGLGACAVAGGIAALSGVGERESGLASGMNTASFQIGGALGTAVASTIALARTQDFIAARGSGDPLLALTLGYQSGFWASVALAVAGIAIALALLGQRRRVLAQSG